MPILTGEEARRFANECFDRAEARMEAERQKRLPAPPTPITEQLDDWGQIQADFPHVFGK